MILDTSFGRYDGAQLEAKSVRKSYSKEHKIQAAEMVLDGGVRKSYSKEHKIQAAEMVLDGGQSVPEVCEILGIGRTALRRWVDQVRQEREGKVPAGAKAITPEQRRIEELESLVRQKDRDIEILKKASALLLRDSKDRSR
ncbi:transposase [Pseudomonas putida]|uniref:transposase n=1 Tax=Pseudomonas putida TaxID=303 RepID=UPI003A0FE805